MIVTIPGVMEDDDYVGRFFKHVYDDPGDQVDLAVAMIINALQWRKSMGVKGTPRYGSLWNWADFQKYLFQGVE